MSRRYETYAPELVKLGFDPTPVKGKRPILAGWSKRPPAALDFAKHADANIGILCGGEHNIIAVDVDILNPFASNELKTLLDDELGFAPMRVGKAPKFMMVYRCSSPVKKQKTGTYNIDGDDCQVEVLAEGQQFVASGVHPDTGRSYNWSDDNLLDYRAEDLTCVSPQQIETFLRLATVMVARYGTLKGRVTDRTAKPSSGLNFSDLAASHTDIKAAVNFIPNDDEHYDDWIATLHAIKGSCGESGFDIANHWSKRSKKYDENQTIRAWESIKTVKKIGAGSIFHWATENGYERERAEKDRRPATLKPAEVLRASEISGPVPPREWLLDQWFPTRTVSALFGQGGVGKTLLVHQLANCVATGDPFLGVNTKKMPVLMVLCEDDSPEIKRRQLSINEWRGLNEITETGPSDLFIWPRVGEDNILVTFPNQGEDVPANFFVELCEMVEWVKTETGEDEIFIVIDTAADTFGGNENIRREVNSFLKTYLGSLCLNFNATVLLLAHPSLSGVATGTGLSGSTAWENSVRARAYLSRSRDADDVRTLSRKKSNYSQSGEDTGITLLWDNGVYLIPSTPDQMDKMESRALKEKIIEAVGQAAKDGKHFRQKTGRKIADALPAILGEPRKKIVKIVADMEVDGEITHETRIGYIVR